MILTESLGYSDGLENSDDGNDDDGSSKLLDHFPKADIFRRFTVTRLISRDREEWKLEVRYPTVNISSQHEGTAVVTGVSVFFTVSTIMMEKFYNINKKNLTCRDQCQDQ